MQQQTAPVNDISLLIKESTVMSYQADNQGRLSLSNLCNLLQEIAWNHANILGVGYEHLLKDNRFWVLIRMYVEIYAYPLWKDAISIRTWPKGAEAFMALRDFKVFGRDGSLAAAASSGWLILEKENKRPVRLDEFRKRVSLREGEHALEKKLLKIEMPQGETIAEQRHTVAYSDIDVNNHVNNAKYVEWIMDAWYGLGAEQPAVAGIELNFLSEAFLGEEVSIKLCRNAGGDSFYAQVFRGNPDSGSGEIIRARFSVSGS
ncbi:MAG: hypothetical protein E4H36_14685 [Spirochaetales bacterium]|nr:MAG: hypothetical protein E4H36_14685 [Spirochaetales bacterium]